jgi:hypothetical protein
MRVVYSMRYHVSTTFDHPKISNDVAVLIKVLDNDPLAVDAILSAFFPIIEEPTYVISLYNIENGSDEGFDLLMKPLGIWVVIKERSDLDRNCIQPLNPFFMESDHIPEQLDLHFYDH